MLTRRDLLRRFGGALVAGVATRLLPGCGDDIQLARGRFLDERQYATLDLVSDLVLPTDADPVPGLGAHAANAVAYIDRLLSAFDDTPPAIFAGGPASGRTPFPDGQGGATKQFPDDGFATFLPLTRVQEIAWRMRLFGSTATAGGAFNDAALGPLVGLRDLYVAGVEALDKAADARQKGLPFFALSANDRALVFAQVAGDEPEFFRALVENTLEGTFAAPEYGGNTFLIGWQLAEYDGDSVPLGHAQYVAASDTYADRSDQPTAQPTPGATTEDFSPEVLDQLTIAAVGSGGMRFF